jgi:hypothetical protein
VRLPDDYRRFLIIVGNGGAGPPHYGMLALGAIEKGYWRDPDRVARELSMPFFFTERWVWDDGEVDDDELDDLHHGLLPLGTEGCGEDWMLVVTGADRGRVWNVGDLGISPCEPPRDFLGWFEDWLEGREREV